MDVYLVGIVEDGGPPALDLPQNPRVSVRMVKGQSVTVHITVRRRSGVPVDLTVVDPMNDPNNPKLTLTVRKHSNDLPYVVKQNATLSQPEARAGKTVFTLDPADTKDPSFLPGIYVYDIWLDRAGTRDAVMPLSPLYLEPNVTSIP